MTVFVDTQELRQTLAALTSEEKAGLKVRRHPWIGNLRMLSISGRSLAGDRLLRDLAERFATCVWGRDGWQVHKVQLNLFRRPAA